MHTNSRCSRLYVWGMECEFSSLEIPADLLSFLIALPVGLVQNPGSESQARSQGERMRTAKHMTPGDSPYFSGPQGHTCKMGGEMEKRNRPVLTQSP